MGFFKSLGNALNPATHVAKTIEAVNKATGTELPGSTELLNAKKAADEKAEKLYAKLKPTEVFRKYMEEGGRWNQKVYDATVGKIAQRSNSLRRWEQNPYRKHTLNAGINFANPLTGVLGPIGSYGTNYYRMRNEGMPVNKTWQASGGNALTSGAFIVGGAAGAGVGGAAGTAGNVGMAAGAGALQGAAQATYTGDNFATSVGTGAATGALGAGVGTAVSQSVGQAANTAGAGAYWGGVAGGAAGGAVVGGGGAALRGDNIGRGALTGAVGGAAGAASTGQPWYGRAALQGGAGAINAGINGGNVTQGAVVGAAGGINPYFGRATGTGYGLYNQMQADKRRQQAQTEYLRAMYARQQPQTKPMYMMSGNGVGFGAAPPQYGYDNNWIVDDHAGYFDQYRGGG